MNEQQCPDDQLIACHECDTLYRIPRLRPGKSALCGRCRAVLFRVPKGGLDRPIALNLAALVLLILANVFPFLILELQGRQEVTTLAGASRALYDNGMWELSVVVLITTILGPALLILCSLYVLLGVRSGQSFPAVRPVLSWISHLEPWAMLDVFMLGVLVAYVKLGNMANMITGPALYAFLGLILVTAAASSAFEPHILWRRLGIPGERRHAG